MIRLLIALGVLAAGIYLLVFKTVGEEEKPPQVIYQDASDKARAVEGQLQEAAERQRQLIDAQTQQ